ncbi:MAG TPA: DUF6691 family protein [Planctomycetota bacterium]|nr:DUF6691 family protein [Planctomycetota bacterium]
MPADLFAPWDVLLGGVLAGLAFGFLLQRAGVTRYDVIVKQFLLQDFTVLKVMFSAILVGGIGIYGMQALGVEVGMHVKSATLLGNVLGGVVFGAGMVILGYCPGTALAAVGDGSRHALVGLLGMLVGGLLYAEAYPWVKANILAPVDLGKVTLPGLTGLSPWWFLGALALGATLGFPALERWERRRASAPAPA